MDDAIYKLTRFGCPLFIGIPMFCGLAGYVVGYVLGAFLGVLPTREEISERLFRLAWRTQGDRDLYKFLTKGIPIIGMLVGLLVAILLFVFFIAATR